MIGEPGVGKTSIVHGLAQRLIAGDVPESIRGAKVIGLELGLLMAGGGSDCVACHEGVLEGVVVCNGSTVT